MKTWFITGTSTGIGRILTEKLLQRGDQVVATLRQVNALDDLKKEFNERLLVAALDVTDNAAIKQVVEQAFAHFGRVDVVVSNAGYALFGAAEEVTDHQIVQQINTNLIGSIQVIRAVLPHLRAQGGGRILQVSSEGGQITYPNFSLYHTTKWGIEGFVEAVAQEVAPFNIEFTLVEPGPTRTNFGGGLVTPPAMAIYEQTPAGAVRQALQDGSFKITGDPEKVVQAMIDSIAKSPAPLRLTMGSDAYTKIRTALLNRVAALDAQKNIAFSTETED